MPGYAVKANEFTLLISQEAIDMADVIDVGNGVFHIIKDRRSLTVVIVEQDGKRMKLEVEGETYVINIKDPLDQTLDNMGFNNVSARQLREIKAPMPGLVLDIAVEEGQDVNEGDRILILEAMKMENSITIHASARIKKVLVKKGQPVEKNQILVELE